MGLGGGVLITLSSMEKVITLDSRLIVCAY